VWWLRSRLAKRRGRFSPNLLSPNLCGDVDMVHGLPSCGSGDLNTEREFPSDKVYRRDDCGVESFGPQGLAFFVIHTVLDVPSCRAVPAPAMSEPRKPHAHDWIPHTRGVEVRQRRRAGRPQLTDVGPCRESLQQQSQGSP
jgi:hypothetical protein